MVHRKPSEDVIHVHHLKKEGPENRIIELKEMREALKQIAVNKSVRGSLNRGRFAVSGSVRVGLKRERFAVRFPMPPAILHYQVRGSEDSGYDVHFMLESRTSLQNRVKLKTMLYNLSKHLQKISFRQTPSANP